MDFDTAFQVSTSNLRFGSGTTREVGLDLQDMGLRRTLLVIDPRLRDPEAMRDTRVTVFSSPEVLAVRWESGPVGLRMRRGEGRGTWSREDPAADVAPPDPAAVEGLLDAARWLRATGFAGGTRPSPATLASLELSGGNGSIDTLAFLEDDESGTVLVRASARPGVLARIARASYEELASKAGSLAR